jgi:predicted nucleotidyltransferase
MNSQDVIARLKENEAALRARGVSHAALFGSRARGDNRPDSDIDIMIEFDPAAHVTVFNYAGLKDYIAGLFDGPVDVVSREGLKPYVRPAATTDAIYAFLTPRPAPCATSRITSTWPPTSRRASTTTHSGTTCARSMP